MPKIKDRHDKKKVKNYHIWLDLLLGQQMEEEAKRENRSIVGQFRHMIQYYYANTK